MKDEKKGCRGRRADTRQKAQRAGEGTQQDGQASLEGRGQGPGHFRGGGGGGKR